MKAHIIKGMLLALLVLQVACTRAVDATNQISFNAEGLSKKLVSSTGEIPMIVFYNMHVDGKTFVDERRCPAMQDDNFSITDCENHLFTQEVNFKGRSFPSGVPVVLQVVIITTDDSENINFYFEGKSLQLIAGSNNVVFNTSDFTKVAGSGSQGEVRGFIPGAASENGVIVGGFQPNASQPEFKIFSGRLTKGHFSAFMPGGIPMTYRVVSALDPSKVKFTLMNQKTVDDIANTVVASTNSAAVFALPRRFRIRSNGGYTANVRAPEKKVIGFFDRTADGIRAMNNAQFVVNYGTDLDFDLNSEESEETYYCSTYPADLSNIITNTNTGALDGNCTNYLSFDADGVYNDLGAAVTVVGGSQTPSSCTNATDGVIELSAVSGCMQISPRHLDSDSAYVKGPFQSIISEDSFYSIDNIGGDVYDIKYKLIPNITTTDLDGIVAFVLTENQERRARDNVNEGYSCGDLAFGNPTAPAPAQISDVVYEAIGSHSATVVPAANQQVIVNVPSNIVNQNDSAVVLCPFSKVGGQNLYWKTALQVRLQSGGSSSSVANKLVLSQVFPSDDFVQNACTPMILEGVGNSGYIESMPDSGTVILNASTGSFYSDPSCSISQASWNVNQGDYFARQVFYKSTTTGSESLSIGLGGNISQQMSIEIPLAPLATNVIAANTFDSYLAIWDHSDLKTNNCYPVMLGQVDSSTGSLATGSSESGIDFSSSVNLSVFYNEGDCVAGINSITSSSSVFTARDFEHFWVKPIVNTTASLVATGLTHVYTYNSGSQSVTDPGAFAYVDVRLHGKFVNGKYPTGVCLKGSFDFYDSNSNRTVGDSSLQTPLFDPAKLNLYTDDSCTTPKTSIAISGGAMNEEFYYRIVDTLNFTLTTNATQVNPKHVDSASIDQSYIKATTSVNAASCNQIVLAVTDSSGNEIGLNYGHTFGSSELNFTIQNVTGLFASDTFHSDGSCVSGDITGGSSSLLMNSTGNFDLGYYNFTSGDSGAALISFSVLPEGILPYNGSTTDVIISD